MDIGDKRVGREIDSRCWVFHFFWVSWELVSYFVFFHLFLSSPYYSLNIKFFFSYTLQVSEPNGVFSIYV